MQEEADSAKDEADELQHMKTSRQTGKTVETQEERLKEGGASISDLADKTTQSNANIVVKSATTKKSAKRRSVNRHLTNYATNSDYNDHGGMFVMRHRENSMLASTSMSASSPEDVWFINSGASNHMTSHQELFRVLRDSD